MFSCFLTIHSRIRSDTGPLDPLALAPRPGRCLWSECVYSVAQSCPTLCGPMDCSPPGSSVHGIFQAGILERVAIPFSGILPIPGVECGLWYYRWIPYHPSHQRSPSLLEQIFKFSQRTCQEFLFCVRSNESVLLQAIALGEIL